MEWEPEDVCPNLRAASNKYMNIHDSHHILSPPFIFYMWETGIWRSQSYL
jgi:hypothetical protein